jgi:F0F1-type ATP synthase membrane subunit a
MFMAATVKKRGLWFVILAGFITLGIYWVYWFYSTAKEIIELNKSKSNPLFWTIGVFIPFVNIYVLYRYCVEAEKMMKAKTGWIVLLLASIVFFPIMQYVVQKELNKYA